MNRALGCVLLLLATWSSPAADNDSAQFEGSQTLLRPANYREWIFVGSSLGLRYNANVPKEKPEDLEFKNIYINPASYREFLKTGTFPQGTILVLEHAAGE